MLLTVHARLRLLTALAIVDLLLRSRVAPAQDLVLLSEGRVVVTRVSDGLGAEPGRWRTQVQQVFDTKTRTLERRLYTLFDPAPSRDLDVLWSPADAETDRAGRIEGRGTLVWRKAGTLEWDKTAVVATYTGDMREGQPNGHGELVTADGLDYRGSWRAGRFEGRGHLQMPGGETYDGFFTGGSADGSGRLTEITGERFDGQFGAGLPEGRGTTTIPSGLSYASDWHHGIESAPSRRLRLAQVGGPNGAGGDDLRIGVTVPRKPVLPPDVDATDVVTYTSTNQGGTLVIVPANKDLMKIWKGDGELQAFDSDDDDDQRVGVLGYSRQAVDATPPVLQVDLQNRSGDPIEIVALRLDVAGSKIDAQPAVQIGDLSVTCVPEPFNTYRLHNFGWSPVRDGTLRIAFGPGTGSPQQSFRISKALGTVQSRLDFSFVPELRAAGVQIEALKRKSKDGFACDGSSLPQCFARIRSNPLFGDVGPFLKLDDTNVLLPIHGVLDYTWRDVDGQDHQRSSPFHFDYYLAHLPRAVECGEGAAPEMLKKSAVRLQLGADDYTIPLSFHRAINAGQTDRLSFALTADKSSQHLFKLTAILADGRTISSRPIDMTFFRPRPQLRM